MIQISYFEEEYQGRVGFCKLVLFLNGHNPFFVGTCQ